MTLLLLCATLALAQAPAQRGARAPAARATRETIYVAVQSPPPTVTVQVPPATVTVEAQSQVPTIVLGVIGLILVGFQLRIMTKQNELSEQQATWKRDEALGTFYRMAFDLAEEFRKVNVPMSYPMNVNYDTHPRQVLRQASAVYAPLGNSVLIAVNQAGMRLDDYFSAVKSYNEPFESGLSRDSLDVVETKERYNSVQSLRGIVGGDLDLANSQIPADVRWKYSDGKDYSFRTLCSKPAVTRSAEGNEV